MKEVIFWCCSPNFLGCSNSLSIFSLFFMKTKKCRSAFNTAVNVELRTSLDRRVQRLLAKCALLGKDRRGRRRNTPARAGRSIKNAFRTSEAGEVQESWSKAPLFNPTLGTSILRCTSHDECDPL